MSTGQKLPLGKALNEIAIKKALNHIHMTGQALPCSIAKVVGSIITLKFEVGGGYNLPNVMVPIIESLYNRGGHQVGDKGFAAPGAVTHGHMSGLGPAGAPGLAMPGNLAALAFHPIGNVNWPDTGGIRLNQGPNGGISQTTDGKNQAGGVPKGVLLSAGGVSTILTPQMIAKLASLLGGSSSGGNAGGSYSGAGGSSTTSGASALQQLLLAYQYVQPTTGVTVTIAQNVVSTIIDPAGALSALTVAFPASPTDSQVQILTINQAVTTLTLGGGALGPNMPTSVAAGGGRWIFQYLAATGSWMLI